MSDLVKYYEAAEAYTEEGYRLEKMKDTSRVLFIQQYVRQLIPQGGRILDVGCGDMYLSKALPEYEWVGIDLAPNVSDGKALKHDLMVKPYPFPDASFDGAVCSEVLEHVWDLRIVNEEVHRVLRPGGHYVMSTPNFDHIDHVLSGYREILFDQKWAHSFEHIRHYNPKVHRELLLEAGFTVLEQMGCDAHFSKFFQRARAMIYAFMTETLKANIQLGQVDQLLGASFPEQSHTIMMVSRK